MFPGAPSCLSSFWSFWSLLVNRLLQYTMDITHDVHDRRHKYPDVLDSPNTYSKLDGITYAKRCYLGH
jgi:hypothetical protein